MGTLRRFERQLENIFEGSFAKAFRGGVHPLEIARRLVREVDDGRVMGVNETLAPNHFQVRLSSPDYQRLSGVTDSLAAEMESLVIAHTNQKGYHLITRPQISFHSDTSLREGQFTIAASLDEPARAQPPTEKVGAGQQYARAENRLGVLTMLGGEKAGISHKLEKVKTSIGRAEENDLVLADPRASRFHAEIDRTPSGYIVRDLESTNGTMVRGRKVQQRLLEDGDTLTIGETEIRFGLITDPRRR
ncbi:MAG: DUF3662 and FHA domain-containing protein [Actinobacteria bacterium]|nr:DUF3662 and FHA domain-containing protein [Actinomycetota bacterium]